MSHMMVSIWILWVVLHLILFCTRVCVWGTSMVQHRLFELKLGFLAGLVVLGCSMLLAEYLVPTFRYYMQVHPVHTWGDLAKMASIVLGGYCALSLGIGGSYIHLTSMFYSWAPTDQSFRLASE